MNTLLLCLVAGVLCVCPTLKQGSRGTCVQTLQRAVGVADDSIFGINTKSKERILKNAVVAFQQLHGLVADGIVGAKTWTVINEGGGGGGEGDGGGGVVGGEGDDCGCSYDYATHCSGGPTKGARKLATYLKAGSHLRSVMEEIARRSTTVGKCEEGPTGVFMRKPPSGPHNGYAGRAVDYFVSLTTGRLVMDHIESIACSNGIQEVIHNRRIWTQAKGERHYAGRNPHVDHIHVGLNHCGAAKFNL